MITFLQADYAANDAASNAVGAVFGLLLLALYFVIFFFCVICLYKIFKKAGQPNPWAAFIPIYNTIVRMDVIKQPAWRFLLYFIPIAGLYFAIVDVNRLSKVFGKDEGFTVGLVLLPFIFYLILAFGDARYQPNALPDNR